MSIAAAPAASPGSASPWRFLPLLYVMQAIPVTIVQELMTIVYKDFGVGNADITKWTSIIALPWSLQMLLGPLVDLTGTKRAWTLYGQAVIAGGLALVPFLFNLPYAFALSLLMLAGVAVVSALTNVATDGFYLLAIPNKDVQASFAGVQTTAYRFGRLFVISGLVFLAGRLSEFAPVRIESAAPGIAVAASEGRRMVRSFDLVIADGKLAARGIGPLDPPVEVGAEVSSITLEANGRVLAGGGGPPREIGRLSSAPTASVSASRRMPLRTAWTIAALAGAALYAAFLVMNRGRLPRPLADSPAVADAGEIRRNVARTLAIVTMYGSGYFAVSSVWKLAANAIASVVNLPGWRLPEKGLFFGVDFGLSGASAELVQLPLAAVVFLACLAVSRRSLRGTPMGEAFASFFRQRGIVAILFFMLFYRFGEAMVAKMSPLFLKALPSEGGIGMDNEKLALIKGIVGVGGIILGGIVGGWFIGRVGLRRALWALAGVMHAPIFLYLLASIARPRPVGAGLVALAIVDFVDQFGYGFGFAGYYVILFRIAQKGTFVTSHYAIGTGLGATFIALAGIASGVIQVQFGYTGFFFAAILLTIPGMLSMFFVPIGDEPAKA